jgi:hypothetical protein
VRLILHAGTHKTGTTSIQRALSAHRPWLRERGYIYPEFPDSILNHNQFAHRLALADDGGLDPLRAELRNVAVPGHAVILSAEEFSARIVAERHWEGFDRADYWERRRAYLDRLRAIPRDFEATVFLCRRDRNEYAWSLYATNLLSDRFRWSFEEFRERCAPVFDYERQEELFRAAFPDVRTERFENLIPGIVPSFCRWTGIPVPPPPHEHAKKTPPRPVILWLHARGKEAPLEERESMVAFARSMPAASGLAEIDAAFASWRTRKPGFANVLRRLWRQRN